MPRMFSYVVQHDTGLAPNPDDGCCTLAVCKFGSPAHRNIVELAEVDDWIVGTGGAGHKSSGHGTIVYAMRVDKIMSLQTYKRDERFKHRQDALFAHGHIAAGRRALISRHYWYFGRAAVSLSAFPSLNLEYAFEKHGPGFRSDFKDAFISEFAKQLENLGRPGQNGNPCCPHRPLDDLTPNCEQVVLPPVCDCDQVQHSW